VESDCPPRLLPAVLIGKVCDACLEHVSRAIVVCGEAVKGARSPRGCFRELADCVHVVARGIREEEGGGSCDPKVQVVL